MTYIHICVCACICARFFDGNTLCPESGQVIVLTQRELKSTSVLWELQVYKFFPSSGRYGHWTVAKLFICPHKCTKISAHFGRKFATIITLSIEKPLSCLFLIEVFFIYLPNFISIIFSIVGHYYLLRQNRKYKDVRRNKIIKLCEIRNWEKFFGWKYGFRSISDRSLSFVNINLWPSIFRKPQSGNSAQENFDGKAFLSPQCKKVPTVDLARGKVF